MAKSWYKSKTKVGALLIGIGAVFGTIGGIINGSVDYGSGMQTLITELGAVYLAFGIRNMPFVNKK
jgi:hypothetical protein